MLQLRVGRGTLGDEARLGVFDGEDARHVARVLQQPSALDLGHAAATELHHEERQTVLHRQRLQEGRLAVAGRAVQQIDPLVLDRALGVPRAAAEEGVDVAQELLCLRRKEDGLHPSRRRLQRLPPVAVVVAPALRELAHLAAPAAAACPEPPRVVEDRLHQPRIPRKRRQDDRALWPGHIRPAPKALELRAGVGCVSAAAAATALALALAPADRRVWVWGAAATAATHAATPAAADGPVGPLLAAVEHAARVALCHR
eukprot:6099616-Prymnesium_polylepis.2